MLLTPSGTGRCTWCSTRTSTSATRIRRERCSPRAANTSTPCSNCAAPRTAGPTRRSSDGRSRASSASRTGPRTVRRSRSPSSWNACERAASSSPPCRSTCTRRPAPQTSCTNCCALYGSCANATGSTSPRRCRRTSPGRSSACPTSSRTAVSAISRSPTTGPAERCRTTPGAGNCPGCSGGRHRAGAAYWCGAPTPRTDWPTWRARSSASTSPSNGSTTSCRTTSRRWPPTSTRTRAAASRGSPSWTRSSRAIRTPGTSCT